MGDDPDHPWVVAIGASGGEGLKDLRRLLDERQDLNAVVMIVVHRPWKAISHLREYLQHSSHLPVSVADDEQSLRAGRVYIGEPASHLTLIAGAVGQLVSDPERHHRNRTVDLLFHSVAEFAGERAVGVVLSGALDDGSRGLAAIKERRGCTMVITPSSMGPSGMPENAISFDGSVDLIGDAPTIARAIRNAVDGHRNRGARQGLPP